MTFQIPQVPTLSNLESKLARSKGRRDSLLQRLREIRNEIVSLKDEESLLDHVEALFRGLIDAEISSAVTAVEELQTEALRTVFSDQDLSVSAAVTTERGKIAVSLVTTQRDSDGIVAEGACQDSFGGSVTTIESVILRLLVLLRRELRPFIILDESLPAFDPDYATNMGQFLMSVCNRLGVDIMMITHNQMLFESAHRAYRIRRHPDGAKFDLVSEVQR